MASKLRLLVALLTLCASAFCMATPRHALVIGNADYRLGPLANPTKDASDIATVLKSLDFEVQALIDADINVMEEAIYTFASKLEAGGIGLFYFAGHGVQFEGENFLMPIGAEVEHEHQLRRVALSVNELMAVMEEASYKNGGGADNLNIVILDACRNNPYRSSFRSPTRGLARVRPASGTLIAYSTTPGDVALDGRPGENSVYTKHLLREIVQPGLDIEKVFKRVRTAVQIDTNMQQVPMEASMLTGDLVLVPGPTTMPGVRITALEEQSPAEQTAAPQILPKEASKQAEKKDSPVIKMLTPTF